LRAVQTNTWQEAGLVLPATARGVLEILWIALQKLKIKATKNSLNIFVLGRSDIVGLPVYYQLKNLNFKVKSLTSNDFNQRINSGLNLLEADVIISATGKHKLITGDLVKKGVIVIDVGEPRPDVDLASVKHKAVFITPVPGGVGPITVVSLLENCVKLGQSL
jgi:methylenetetrahydrofolate dehydrogenase (NADP+)/methenyltetrahydrofolate cyclohydrolase